MLPEYYANEYRRYQTYCRDYGSHKLYKIACGPGTPDTEWTEVVMKMAHDKMDALTMHYYTVPTGVLAGQGQRDPIRRDPVLSDPASRAADGQNHPGPPRRHGQV